MYRGRAQSQKSDWDPMRDEFEESTYEAQYPDDDTSSGVNLDHCRLYITNIPKPLNNEGLRTAFSKYGTLTEVFVASDPQRRYGLVAYETPGEAKLAMMKLNRTEPLKLNIAIAHKRGDKKTNDNRQRDSRDRSERTNVNGSRDREPERQWEETSSIGSRRNQRKQDETSHAGEHVEVLEPDMDLTDTLDPDLHLELEQLKLQQLKIQEAEIQCRQRMLLLNRASKRTLSQTFSTKERSFLPDGKIIVKNTDKSSGTRDEEGGFTGGAGDALKTPGLQRARCVACSEPADALCAKCGVTPYCSANCQRADWSNRHRNVCHNLQRLFKEGNSEVPEADPVSSVPAVAPLRRPKSPAVQIPKSGPKKDLNTSGNIDRGGRNFRPAGATSDQFKNRNSFNNSNHKSENWNDGNRRSSNRNNSERDDKYNNKENGPNNNRFNRNNNSNNNNYNRKGFDDKRHQQHNVAAADEDEEWGAAKPKATPAVEQPRPEPKPVVQESSSKPRHAKEVAPATAAESRPILTVNDVTPNKKFVPKNYMMDLLTPGTTAVLICESRNNTRAEPNGMVCVSMQDDFQTSYQQLCEDYSVKCEADAEVITPAIGDLFSLLNPDDGGWYRARLLNESLAALIDSGKIVTFKPPAKKVSSDYVQIPEMCCLLLCDGVKDGDSVQCTILSKSDNGIKVSLTNVESGASVGEGIVSRWIPQVEYPVVNTQAPAVATEIPTVPRPVLTNNSSVVLVDASNLTRALIRSCDPESIRAFDNAVEETLLFAVNASPLTEPPQKGQMVIGKFTDGLHYRALCKRTSVKQNKYLIEYIEYGNEEITTLEKLYPCPPKLDLEQCPCRSSIVKISTMTVTPQATEYLQKLIDDSEQLLLILPSGEKTAPSGSEVVLTVAKNRENLNKLVEKMCSPEWKAIKDVVETKRIMFNELKYQPLPQNCELDILDISEVKEGNLSCCIRNDKHYDFVTGPLTLRMTEYCLSDIGKEPYLPMPEELCIAQYPPDPTWYRAVLIEQINGPGSTEARVMYIDYGNVAQVPCSALRKMLPEFVAEVPALACQVEVHDFPKDATPEMLARGLCYMKINDEGRGVLKPDKIEKQDEDGIYTVYCKALIDAMKEN